MTKVWGINAADSALSSPLSKAGDEVAQRSRDGEGAMRTGYLLEVGCCWPIEWNGCTTPHPARPGRATGLARLRPPTFRRGEERSQLSALALSKTGAAFQTVEVVDCHVAVVFDGDDIFLAQLGHLAADGFDGQAEEVGDVGAGERQVECQ